MIKNVIFDLDGTLLDTREGIAESVRFAAGKLGFGELSHETLMKFAGPPIQQSFMTFCGCDKEMAQKGANIFRDYYKTYALFRAKPYEGIYDLCEILRSKRLKMAVATYKREDYALMLLRHFGFDRYCDPMHGADNDNILKKEDIVRVCREEMGAKTEECVLIGDTDHDARGAFQAGISFIAVTYGYGFKHAGDAGGYPCMGIVRNPLEIADILLKGVT